MAYELDWNRDNHKWNKLPRRCATREELCAVITRLLDLIDPNQEASCIELKLNKVD